MPWFCDNCGERRTGAFCKCGVHNEATRIPPLDGFVFFNADGTGRTRLDEREWEMTIFKKGASPAYTKGVRPPGWKEALERIGERAAKIIANGVDIPEC